MVINDRLKNDLTGPIFKVSQKTSPKPLSKYTIQALSQTKFEKSKLELGEILKDEATFTSRFFYFYVDGKMVSGLVSLPKRKGIHPTVIMFRGYIDQQEYTTGDGTRRAAEGFAQNGFITLAPDFLGYGTSDKPSDSPIEERFQTYTTALTLIASLSNLDNANPSQLFLWGHSNGGQIALTILEITGKSYPTVLWAPVSKPFPYSILYYTDDFDDHGKALRKVVADFERDYDVEEYSLTNYFENINAPLQIHQGTADEAVPSKWSDQLVEKLKSLGKEVDYYVYTGDDHNFAKGSWPEVMERAVAFYRQYLN